jgi:conjugal transfer/entry exclusion protein
MTEQIVLPTGIRGYVRELQAQIQVLSERAANLAANLAAANEQNELHLARIDTLQDELAKAKEPRDPKPDAPPG